jgi:hypothetical protein
MVYSVQLCYVPLAIGQFNIIKLKFIEQTIIEMSLQVF